MEQDEIITRLQALRALLFVPGDRPDRFDKAMRSGADAIIIDLEDAVALNAKASARESVQAWLTQREVNVHDKRGPLVLLRLNAGGMAGSEVEAAELALGAHAQISAVVVPKADSASTLTALHYRLGGKPLMPIIESATGVSAVQQVAAAPGVVRLLFGSIDLMLDLDIQDEEALEPYRAQTVLTSRAAGLASPIDGVMAVYDQPDVLAQNVMRAKRRGWGGKLCIHPAQVPVVQKGMAPTEAEVAQAMRIVEAARHQASGAFSLDGAMVDAPVLARARSILATTLYHPA